MRALVAIGRIGPLARAALLAAATAAIFGCGPSAKVQQAEESQFALRGMIASDRQEIDALKQRMNRMQDEIDEFRRGGGAGGRGRPATSKQLASINERISKLESQMSALQMGATMTAPGAGGAVAGAPGGPEPATSPAPGAGEVARIPPSSGGEEAPPGAAAPPDWRSALDSEAANAASSSDPGAARFRKGLNDMKDGQYQSAITRFGDLMRRYPKSPLSEPAEYFSAIALYESGKYDQSILQFNDLVMRFPRGRFASAALLRQAQAFLRINDRIDARLTLQKLLNDHGSSAEAPAADAMMKDLVSN